MGRIFFIFFFSGAIQLVAQSNKNDTLREVFIINKTRKNESGVQTVDSNILRQYLHTSLQNVLQLHSNVFVKNYGIGALSTISIRGSSAAQTAVLWHGMNINNAMIGISDFSILPVSLFDEIKINYSGNTMNALAGNIELNNVKPVFNKHTTVDFGIAYESLQNGAAHASIRYSDTKYCITVKGFYQYSKNIFRYYNSEKEAFEILSHANSKTKGILSDIYIKFFPHHTLGFHAWAQESNREIPPALFEKMSSKNEKNHSLKAILDYDIKLDRWSTKTSIGVTKDKLDYADSLISFASQAEALTIPFTETLHIFPSAKQNFSIQASAIYSKLLTGSQDNLQRAIIALQYETEPSNKNLFVKTYLQKEYTNVFSLPWIAGISLKQKVYKESFVVASVTSNYRTPTLNELYFTPGGNKNLKPEISKNLEGGIENYIQHQQHSFKSTATLFTRNVSNWIVWYGGAILTPHNIQKVRSRGLEMDINYKYEIGNKRSESRDKRLESESVEMGTEKASKFTNHHSSFYINLLYAYTLSTTKESARANDYSIDKQIPYVPRYQIKLNFGFTKNAFDINYVYAYTGYRFVTTDESEYLLPYNTHNIFSSYTIPIKSMHQLLATFKVNNILNKSYESIVGRVMPGRNFSVGLNYRLKGTLIPISYQ